MIEKLIVMRSCRAAHFVSNYRLEIVEEISG